MEDSVGPEMCHLSTCSLSSPVQTMGLYLRAFELLSRDASSFHNLFKGMMNSSKEESCLALGEWVCDEGLVASVIYGPILMQLGLGAKVRVGILVDV